MSRQVWKGSTLLNPEPPVLVSIDKVIETSPYVK